MNIEKAKWISIAQILEKLGLKPTKKTTNDEWYLSPFREEQTASFHVRTKRNIWYDFGLGSGGDVIHFACIYLESQKQSHSVSDGLKWLADVIGNAQIPIAIHSAENTNNNPRLSIKSVNRIRHGALVNYLTARGIKLKVATEILREVSFHDSETNKTYFALGLHNEEEGYELRNSFFKGCVGAKSISFIRGSFDGKPDDIHLFEGFMDYLSVITQREGRPFQGDTIILNSLSCIKHAKPYIKGYGYKRAYTWMDNDKAGETADQTLKQFFNEEQCLVHIPTNFLYQPHKDVNAWHMNKLGL